MLNNIKCDKQRWLLRNLAVKLHKQGKVRAARKAFKSMSKKP